MTKNSKPQDEKAREFFVYYCGSSLYPESQLMVSRKKYTDEEKKTLGLHECIHVIEKSYADRLEKALEVAVKALERNEVMGDGRTNMSIKSTLSTIREIRGEK